MPITHRPPVPKGFSSMTTTIQHGSPEAPDPPVVFSHPATDMQVTRAAADERVRPVLFSAPANGPRR